MFRVGYFSEGNKGDRQNIPSCLLLELHRHYRYLINKGNEEPLKLVVELDP